MLISSISNFGNTWIRKLIISISIFWNAWIQMLIIQSGSLVIPEFKCWLHRFGSLVIPEYKCWLYRFWSCAIPEYKYWLHRLRILVIPECSSVSLRLRNRSVLRARLSSSWQSVSTVWTPPPAPSWYWKPWCHSLSKSWIAMPCCLSWSWCPASQISARQISLSHLRRLVHWKDISRDRYPQDRSASANSVGSSIQKVSRVTDTCRQAHTVWGQASSQVDFQQFAMRWPLKSLRLVLNLSGQSIWLTRMRSKIWMSSDPDWTDGRRT